MVFPDTCMSNYASTPATTKVQETFRVTDGLNETIDAINARWWGVTGCGPAKWLVQAEEIQIQERIQASQASSPIWGGEHTLSTLDAQMNGQFLQHLFFYKSNSCFSWSHIVTPRYGLVHWWFWRSRPLRIGSPCAGFEAWLWQCIYDIWVWLMMYTSVI